MGQRRFVLCGTSSWSYVHGREILVILELEGVNIPCHEFHFIAVGEKKENVVIKLFSVGRWTHFNSP